MEEKFQMDRILRLIQIQNGGDGILDRDFYETKDDEESDSSDDFYIESSDEEDDVTQPPRLETERMRIEAINDGVDSIDGLAGKYSSVRWQLFLKCCAAVAYQHVLCLKRPIWIWKS